MDKTNMHFFIVESESGSYNLIVNEDENITDKYFPLGTKKPRRIYRVVTTLAVELKPYEEPKVETNEPAEEPAGDTDGNVS